jgi:hypothetical protein
MNNPNLTLIGTGDFSLIIGATTAPPSESAYDKEDWSPNMFGNVKELTILNEQEAKDHFGSYRGVRMLDRTVTTQLRKGYKLKLDDFDHRAMMMLFHAYQSADAGTIPQYQTFTPFGMPQSLRGFGRIRLWDPADPVNPRFVHKNFLCVVRFEGDFSLGEDFSEYEIKVDVLSPVGTVYLKKV